MGTIPGRVLFSLAEQITQIIFKGGYYFPNCAETIRRAGTIFLAGKIARVLFQGRYHSRAGTIPGQVPFQGRYHSRAGTIPGQVLCEEIGYTTRLSCQKNQLKYTKSHSQKATAEQRNTSQNKLRR